MRILNAGAMISAMAPGFTQRDGRSVRKHAIPRPNAGKSPISLTSSDLDDGLGNAGDLAVKEILHFFEAELMADQPTDVHLA